MTEPNIKTEIIYKLFGGMQVTGLGGKHGSNYIGDFLNSKILSNDGFDESVFERLGKEMYRVYKDELDNRERPFIGTNQFLRLRQVERKLKELQDEISCIRNND